MKNIAEVLMLILKNNKSPTIKKLTIVTVVKDDLAGLIKTAESVDLIYPREEIQYVVWINSSSQSIVNSLESFSKYADVIVLGNDFGIFDAMNKSLEFSTGEFVLFLNAKDVILEGFNLDYLNEPSLIKVKYKNYFGFEGWVKPSKLINRGIPYCHQGMILPRYGYHYDVDYKFGADYLALINLNLKWPLPFLNDGVVRYDTTGVSTVNRFKSDKWTAKVIEAKFGKALAIHYLLISVLKLIIKRIYDVYKYFKEVVF